MHVFLTNIELQVKHYSLLDKEDVTNQDCKDSLLLTKSKIKIIYYNMYI